MLTPELSSRYGARTVPSGRVGVEINKEVRQHEWLDYICWDRIEARIERVRP